MELQRAALEIRRLTRSDASQFNPFMQQIARETTHTLRYVGQEESPIEEIAARWGEGFEKNTRFYLGAFDEGRLVGYLLCFKPNGEHPWMRHVGYFAMMIHQSHSGQGLGRELLGRLDEYARQEKLTRIEATVRTDNERALALYLKCGYQIEGLRRHAACIDGSYRDEHYIAKIYG